MTLKGPKTVEGRHIKQSGGSGQFAVARVKFSCRPRGRDLKFIDGVKGGSVPREYIKPVEYGIRRRSRAAAASASRSARSSPSSTTVRRTTSTRTRWRSRPPACSRSAWRSENNSILLEPIMKIEIEAPEDKTGDVIGDLNSRVPNETAKRVYEESAKLREAKRKQ
jgi:elongation factor G